MAAEAAAVFFLERLYLGILAFSAQAAACTVPWAAALHFRGIFGHGVSVTRIFLINIVFLVSR